MSSQDNDDKNDEETCKNYHYMPANYHECKDRFGIIFHDNLTVSDRLVTIHTTI